MAKKGKKKKEYQVHVYKVTSKIVVDVEAESDREALEKAGKTARETKRFNKADCKHVMVLPTNE